VISDAGGAGRFSSSTNRPYISKSSASRKENVDRKINELKLNQTKHEVRRWLPLAVLPFLPPNGGGLTTVQLIVIPRGCGGGFQEGWKSIAFGKIMQTYACLHSAQRAERTI